MAQEATACPQLLSGPLSAMFVEDASFCKYYLVRRRSTTNCSPFRCNHAWRLSARARRLFHVMGGAIDETCQMDIVDASQRNMDQSWRRNDRQKPRNRPHWLDHRNNTWTEMWLKCLGHCSAQKTRSEYQYHSNLRPSRLSTRWCYINRDAVTQND